GMWWDDMEDHGGTIQEIEAATNFYLTEKGEAAAKRLIREDKRRNAEWWIKMISSIVAFVTGLLGALIGVIAVLKRCDKYHRSGDIQLTMVLESTRHDRNLRVQA